MKTGVMYSKFGNRINYIWRQHDEERRKRKSGRFSIYYGRNLDRSIGGKISAEYCVLRPVYLLGADMEIGGDERPVKFAFWLWPFSIYIGIETPTAKRIAVRLTKPTYDGEREIALHIAPRSERSSVRWSVWHPVHSWDTRTPRWRYGSFDIIDFAFGRRDMRWEPVSKHDVSIPMPERWYDGSVEIKDHVSWRKRLPFLTKRVRCANVDIPGGIGFPGKGENAWDCGDDAMFGMSCGAENVEEAIGKVVASVLQSRKRYGGSYTFTPSEAG